MIDVAVVDDDLMLIDGLRAWMRGREEFRLAGVATTVTGLLASMAGRPDVVLLGLMLRDRSDPAANVRRLAEARHRVLVVSGWADSALVATAYKAGAQGCITKDRGLAALGAAIHQTAAGEAVCSQELACALLCDPAPPRPRLSAREHDMLMAYASGMTLETAARHLGIKPASAKTYLLRVRAKYEELGRPASTKLELAERVWEDYHPRP
ncbi:MAG TPA: response regulator [Streptosporangiaceae bacterium]|nr:response regulator [Streptosporangiaceae bacterium]